jgi:hypothetical protein
MRRTVVMVLLLAGLLVACGGFDPDPIVPEVWSKHGPDGASYEFKVNDFEQHARAEDGFLYGLSAVSVRTPGGSEIALVQEFPDPAGDPGVVNPRWVIYGPPGAGFPVTGRYAFVFLRDGAEVRRMHVDYRASHIGFATDVAAELDGDVLRVTWTPPAGDAVRIDSYKVLVYVAHSSTLLISERLEGGAWSSVDIDDAATRMGAHDLIAVNVAAYGDASFSYSANLILDLSLPKDDP